MTRLRRTRSAVVKAGLAALVLAAVLPFGQVFAIGENSSANGFHLCRSKSMLFPQMNSTSVNSAGLGHVNITILYQCGGDEYDRFAVQMEDYVLRKYYASRNSSAWGRRKLPFLDSVTVLAIGNSHLRQTMHSLCCQYSHLVTGVRTFDFPDVPIHEFRFINGASLVLSSNSPLVYSTRWHKLLRKYDPLHRSLKSYDAVFWGTFNLYNTSLNDSSHKKMLAIQAKYPDEVMYSTVPPPTLADLLGLYSKPVVALPMFAQYGLAWENASRATRSCLFPRRRRSTVVVKHGRAHVEALGQECGTDGTYVVGKCYNAGESNPYGRDPVEMHRCNGPGGGHPDLLAWDAVESLHKLLAR